MLDRRTRIAIAGAGSIGCYAGGCLALAGSPVTLLARQRIADAVCWNGLVVADLGGGERKLSPAMILATSEPAEAFAGAGLVLVTVKSGDTVGMAELIARHAPPDAVIVSLQNGVRNAALLRERLPAPHRVIAGMVSFNVIQEEDRSGALTFLRATGGEILLETGMPELVDLLDVEGLPTAAAKDMDGILWGKLILNLANALNALSGLPLAKQLSDRRWRLVLAVQIDEALAAMRKAGIAPVKVGAVRPTLLPHILRLPDFLFHRVARRMLAVDPRARPSTAVDLERGRPTETDEFQGAVLRLAEKVGTEAPLSRLVLDRMREAETAGRGSPRLAPDAFALPSR
jgi:2-dehydropantoate 2-reductase